MVNLLTPGELERSRKVYQQLGLRDFATAEEIKRAYRDLALLHHPDKNPTDPDAINRFRLINEAYQILSDEGKRKRYDSALQSAQATASLYGGGANFPNSSARHHNNNSSGSPIPSSSGNFNGGGDAENHFYGSVPTPQQFREQMNNIPKRRHPTTATMNSGSTPTAPNAAGNYYSSTTTNGAAATPTSPLGGIFDNNNQGMYQQQQSSDSLNEEYKRKEKARFAEMKRRLDNERAQQQEAEFQKLQKQQNDQRREQQRRQREQERIREKLDKALQQTPGSSASDANKQFQRIGSSQNQGPSSQFRASSSNNNNTKNPNITNPKSINTPTYFSSSSNNKDNNNNNSATRARSANNNNISGAPEYTFASSHSYAKHTTFATSFGARRSMSPLGSPTGNTSARLQQQQQQHQKENIGSSSSSSPTQQQHFSPSKKIAINAGDGSPEMVAQARIRIEKDIEVLPTEETEERDNFLNLQERHERALLMSRFRQEGDALETELLFRTLFDEETAARFALDCAEVVERSAINGWYQCVIERECLLREAFRIGHGLWAWHENIWQHMRAHLARRALLTERYLLERSAVVEDQEAKEFERLCMFGTTLHRKFHVASLEEDRARSNLCLDFYNGAKAIEASRRFISQLTLRMSKEEALARERLAVELGEMWARGLLAEEHAQRCADTVTVRTTAISGYITALQTKVAEMHEKVANHNAIVGGLNQTIDMHKRDNEREREEHETQVALMRGDLEGMESQVAKLRTDLLTSQEKLIEENERYKRLEDDKKTLEKKLGDVRAMVRLEHEAELRATKEEAKNREDALKKELEAEREKYAALYERFEKLRGKHTEAAEFLKDMVERDEKQKKVIERLKNEVKMMRQLDDIENGGEGNSPNNNHNDNNNDDENLLDYDENTNNNNSKNQVVGVSHNSSELDRSGSQVSVFDVEKSQQQLHQQQQKNNNTNSTTTSTPTTPSSRTATATKPSTTTTTGAKQPMNNTSSSIRRLPTDKNNNSSPGLNQTPAQNNASTPRKNNNNDQLSPESTLANRHTRSVRLEQRLYTAAAAASAASVVLAQKESSSSSIRRNPTTTTSNDTKTPPRGINNSSNSTNQQTPPPPIAVSSSKTSSTATTPIAGRPPLSPSASLKNNTTTNTNTPPPPPVTQQQHIDPKISYRELSGQVRPKTLRQVTEWEEEDAIAVAQREAVASFLQKQAGANLMNAATANGYTDDPRQAQLHIRPPVVGKGLLEYAGISTTPSSSPLPTTTTTSSDCNTCDMNKNAISKLVTTTDKLLLRNVGLVDDNETLAQAVVVMNAQREANARANQQQQQEPVKKSSVVTITEPI